MPLITIILALIAVGFLLWVVNSSGWIPMPDGIKKLINVVSILVIVVWLLRVLGIWAYIAQIHI
jgi:hypothetical protein